MTFKTAIMAPLLALALAGCGNDADKGSALAIAKGLFPAKASAGVPQKIDRQAALARTSGPLVVVSAGAQANEALLLRIEENGPYETFATANRQTVTFRQGMVTSTRGLGDDLMSSNPDQALALITARKPGASTRQMQYLDGANNRINVQFNCDLAIAGQSRQMVSMTETCTSESRDFVNEYHVDSGGHIVNSRQWISPMIGSYNIVVLRR
ncbi:YjbF family lipoprotein [Thalassovita sp.]|uniref:YjbF family lipoprotein n=1 Tax=Thalassovita sp. TaxID=1979401 RepID=UPI0029DE85B2|nr:YjbF family lipoprotein [Thalassovita sp.]